MSLYQQFRNLRDSFRAVFEHGSARTEEGELTLHAKRVMVELRQFCRADQSTFDPDARIHALREGRREVLLKIQQYMNLSDIDLMKLQDPDERKDDDHD